MPTTEWISITRLQSNPGNISHIQHNRIEHNNFNGMTGVVINDIRRQHHIANLHTSRICQVLEIDHSISREAALTKEESNLTSHPMPASVNRQSPQNQPNRGSNRSRKSEPQSHLGHTTAIILPGQPRNKPVAQSAGTKDLGEYDPNYKA